MPPPGPDNPSADRWPGRLPLRWRRLRPRFVIIGAQKAGTTSLFHALAAHPRVRPPSEKEPSFFSYRRRKGARWYVRRFPRAGEGLVTGEASPSYLFDPFAPARMRAVLPDARLIVILRDPVERAYSQYHHVVRHGHEERPFRQAIDDERAAILPRFLAGDLRPDEVDHPLIRKSLLSRGIYALQLERWLDAYPRSRLLVLESADLKARPREVLEEVTDFIGIERHAFATGERRNVGDYEPLGAELRRELRDFYRPFDERLAELLGRRFSWMEAEAGALAARNPAARR